MTLIQIINYLPVVYCFFLIVRERSFIKRISNSDFLFLLVCTLISCIGNVWIVSSRTIEEAYLSQRVSYIGTVFLMYFTFVLIVTTCKIQLPKVLRIILGLSSIFSICATLTIGKNGLFYKDASLVTENGYSHLVKVYGPLHHVYTAIVFFYMIGSLAIAIYSLLKPALVSRARAFTFALCETVCVLIYLLERGFKTKVEILSFAFVVAVTIYGASIKKMYLYDANRVANDYRESSKDYAVILFDEKKRYVGSNATALDLFPNIVNYYVEQYIADKYEEKIYFEKLLSNYDECINNKEAGEETLKSILEKDGKIFSVSVRKLINETVKGDRGYIIEFVDDTRNQEYIRTINQMNHELEGAVEEAKAANSAKSQFLANMSHEIRTPINAVLGLNSIILRDTKEESIREYAADVENSGKSLLALINDILDFSKIEAGKMDIVPVEYNLASLIIDCQNMMYARVNDKGLEFELRCDEATPSVLYGDEVRIRQIVINLLTNAAKYTVTGYVLLIVRGEVKDDKAVLSFKVKDTGIGIKTEDLKKLADTFVRIEEKRNKAVEGTGLGLSIVCNYLKLMDSSLKVVSEYGNGSEFFFEIEQKITDMTHVGNISGEVINVNDEEYSSEFTAPDAKILVVDDNNMNLFVITELLKETEMTLDTAISGKICLDMTAKNKYDLIFMDHMMPGINGIDTLKELRKDDGIIPKYTKVIALTANAISGAADLYRENGFDGYLTKPIDTKELDDCLRSNLTEDIIEDIV